MPQFDLRRLSWSHCLQVVCGVLLTWFKTILDILFSSFFFVFLRILIISFCGHFFWCHFQKKVLIYAPGGGISSTVVWFPDIAVIMWAPFSNEPNMSHQSLQPVVVVALLVEVMVVVLMVVKPAAVLLVIVLVVLVLKLMEVVLEVVMLVVVIVETVLLVFDLSVLVTLDIQEKTGDLPKAYPSYSRF